jgi:hypothetical protein
VEANGLVEIKMAHLRTTIRMRCVANEEARKNQHLDREAYDIGTALIKTALVLLAVNTLFLA